MVLYEKIVNDEKLPMKLICFAYQKNEDRSVEKHWHNSLEIVVATKGSVIVWIDGVEHVVSAGENNVLIINPTSIHSFRSVESFEPYQGYTIQVNYDFIKKNCPTIDMLWFKQPDRLISERIEKDITEIANYYHRDNRYRHIKIESYLLAIIYTLLKELSMNKDHNFQSKSEKNKKRITDIINYIDQSYQEDISLDTIADQFQISKGHLSKLFRENLNISVKTYLSTVRLRHAKFDLENTDLPLIDIAYKNGIPNVKSLNQLFMKQFKLSPSKYRKNIRK